MHIPTPPEQSQNTSRGVGLILLAVFLISVQDVIFKLFSSTLPLGQIFTLRAMLALPMLYAVAVVLGSNSRLLTDALKPWILLRSLFLTFMFLAFYGAIPFVSLSMLGAGSYTAPIFVTLFTAALLRERTGLPVWAAVICGFVGVLVLLKPGTDDFSPWAVLPIIGAIFYALAHIITRTKCRSDSVAALALSLKLMMLTAGLCISGVLLAWPPGNDLVHAYPYLFGVWAQTGSSEWLILAVLAVLTVLIGLTLAGAYQAAPPAIVAIFEYAYLIFAALWDAVFFDTLPTRNVLIGILLIIGAGLLVLKRR